VRRCVCLKSISCVSRVPKTPDPKIVVKHFDISGQFGGAYGVSFETSCINNAPIARVLDSGVSWCPVLSKVPVQHFHPPPDPYKNKNCFKPRKLTHV